MRIITLLALLSLGGCSTFWVGVGAHWEAYDRPEVTIENPVCEIGGEMRSGRLGLAFQHHSACFHREDGAGYNVGTVRYYLK